MDLVSKTKSIIIGCNFHFKILVCMADIQVAAVLAKKFPFIRERRKRHVSIRIFIRDNCLQRFSRQCVCVLI
jgi:hypothetical protein